VRFYWLWKKKEIKPIVRDLIKSQHAPSNNAELPIRVITGFNFVKEVFENKKDVLILHFDAKKDESKEYLESWEKWRNKYME